MTEVIYWNGVPKRGGTIVEFPSMDGFGLISCGSAVPHRFANHAMTFRSYGQSAASPLVRGLSKIVPLR